MRASKEFNLTLTAFEDEDSDTGIWDGQEFVLVVSSVLLDFPTKPYTASKLNSGSYFKSWWTTLKVLWRYGYTAPTRTKAM